MAQLKGFYDAIQALVAQRKLLAYHDRSDGGLLVTLAEMAFTGHCGVEANIGTLGEDRLAVLFNEELGAVIQVRAADREAVEALLAQHGPADCVHYPGKAVQGDRFVIEADGHAVFSESRTTLRMWWAETTGRCSACVITRTVPIRNTTPRPTTTIPPEREALLRHQRRHRCTVHCDRRASESRRAA